MSKVKDAFAKTKRYLKRNGFSKTVSAAMERISQKEKEEYAFSMPSQEELERQRLDHEVKGAKLSIVVPTYETKELYLRQMVESLLEQTYSNWELVIADASATDTVRTIVKEYQEKDAVQNRIILVSLNENKGISENTNAGLKYATGDYIGLLDHDDVITPDALYYVAKEILHTKPVMIYSDEDKADEKMTVFYEPHRKKKLNIDLILSNNYICHLCVVRADVIKKLQFRSCFDGAQDFDFILRCIEFAQKPEEVVHIPRILYHWRCHPDSTAANTDSKQYAYENGRRAVEDYCNRAGYKVTVTHTDHLGFYRVNYLPDYFSNRPEIGIVGGPVYRNGKVAGGAMHRDGTLLFGNLPKNYSGYMHRAKLQQRVSAVDIRNMVVCKELSSLLKEYQSEYREEWDKKPVQISLSFCERARMMGYYAVYDPQLEVNK